MERGVEAAELLGGRPGPRREAGEDIADEIVYIVNGREVLLPSAMRCVVLMGERKGVSVLNGRLKVNNQSLG